MVTDGSVAAIVIAIKPEGGKDGSRDPFREDRRS
jgi:hypothetical protein